MKPTTELGPTIWSSSLTEDQIKEARKALSDEVFRQEYDVQWLSHDEQYMSEISFEELQRRRRYPRGRRRS